MKHWAFFFSILCCGFLFNPIESDARRTHITPEQKTQLQQAQTVLVTVLALTEKGRTDPAPLIAMVTQRLQEVGYAVVADQKQPHDVEFKVKCEERKTWTGTTAEGGDAELADAPDRLWKGPACLLTYILKGKNLGWYKEVRAPFEDAMSAAKSAGAKDSGSYALEQLTDRLATYDFPLFISAEWGQPNRLLKLLDSPNTSQIRKLKILSILSDLQTDEALPHLTEIMKQKDLAKEAVSALAGVGADSIPLLIDLFQNSNQVEIKAAAATALGDVAGASGNSSALPPLLKYLKDSLKNMNTSEDINYPVLIPVVWSLGKLIDDNSIKPLAELNDKVWLINDNSPEMKELREAAFWSYRQVDLTQFAT